MQDMHSTVNMIELVQEITAKGYNVLNIHNVKNRVSKSPLPMFFVELEQKDNNKEIYNIQFVIKLKIRFEPPYEKREIIQCQSCNRYRHSKNYYHIIPRCVKRAGTGQYTNTNLSVDKRTAVSRKTEKSHETE